jgi:HAE1 family hydrophobic/amphiphilic exporter-1
MIRFAVDHPVATWMLFTALIVTGVYAVPRLNIEAMPETDLPELSIVTSWNGASPSAIQRSITLPI